MADQKKPLPNPPFIREGSNKEVASSYSSPDKGRLGGVSSIRVGESKIIERAVVSNSNLPNGWQERRLDDVCDFIGGSQPPKSTFVYNLPNIDDNYIRLIQIRDYKSDEHIVYIPKNKAKRFCKKHDVMIGRYGPPVFQILRGLEGAYNVALMKAEPRSESLDKKFLFLFLQTPKIQHYIVSLSERASGQTGINKKALNDYPIPLPPLPEQIRIVAILDEAFAGISQAVAHAEKNLANARELFDSYLNQVFTRKGEGWRETPLEKIVQDDCSLSYGIVQPGEDFANGLPIVRPTNLTKKVIKLNGLKLMEPMLANSYKRTMLQGGEILLCVRGSTGVMSLASDELKGANVTRGIVPVRFDENYIIQDFGYYQMISKIIQDQIKKYTYGTALMQINIRDIRKLEFLVPPIVFQIKAIEELESLEELVDKLTVIYRRKLAALAELKQSLLQKAFTGELTASKS